MMRLLKLSVLSLCIVCSQAVLANTPVEGKIFYKLPNDNLVSRNVTLEVPSRGQGEVILKGQNFEWSTTDFNTIRTHGQTLFEAVFSVEWVGETSKLKFVGTYIQAKNIILYYGDIYKMRGVEPTHIGGFKFSFDRQN